MNRWIWLFVAGAFAALLWVGHDRAEAVTPGHGGGGGAATAACVLPALPSGLEPVQVGVPSAMRPFRHGDFVLSPLAGFSLEARVLSREDYSLGPESALSPTDLALGWRRMADPDVYGTLGVTQAGRWYRYRWDSRGPPIPLPEIVRSSANMHIVPADEHVQRALDVVRPDQRVRLQGWLIEARRDDGWIWRSSLRRDDSGDGACELVYVCALTTY